MDKIPKVIPMFSWPNNIKELFLNVYQLSAILKIQDGRHSGCTIANIVSIKTNRIICLWITPHFQGQGITYFPHEVLLTSSIWDFEIAGIGHLGFHAVGR